MQRKSLAQHMVKQHDIFECPERRSVISTMFEQPPQTYNISIPTEDDPFDCPVSTCPAIFKTRYGLRSNFAHRHWNDDLIILEEGPLQRCPNCLMFCSNTFTEQHTQSNVCLRGTLRHQHRLQQQANEIAESIDININNQAIEHIETFKYLGRIMSATSNDIPAVNHNLKKSKITWGRIRILLKREGADKKTSLNFYKTIIQSTLLYGAETWQLPQHGVQPLEVFHNYVKPTYPQTTKLRYLGIP
jgi:hypothetical protein